MIKILVYEVKTKNLTGSYKSLLKYFSAREKKLLARKRNTYKYILSIIAKVTVKKLISDLINISIKDIEMYEGKFGRPYVLRPDGSYFDFNISFSDNFFAIAITDNGRIGIDIEYVKDFDIDSLNNIFSSTEMEYILSVSKKDESLEKFYKLWTCKEAIVKAEGTGLLNIPKLDFNNSHMLNMKNKITWNNNVYFLNTIKFNKLIISICTSERLNKGYARAVSFRRLFIKKTGIISTKYESYK
jgi:4'-phosphopantetheinyl transferase